MSSRDEPRAGARLPYQPLVDAMRLCLEREAALDTLLSDTWLVELSRLLPELRDRRPDLPIPAGDEAAARTRLFESLARLGRTLAEQAPLVLFIDDVQWSDVALLDVLRYVGRRWTQVGAPILLLFCLRTEAIATTPALADWLLSLRRDLEVAVFDLGPLTIDDTRRLLLGFGAGPTLTPETEQFARWIFAETSGQPFYVVETLRALHERGVLTARRNEDGTRVFEVLAAPDQGLLPAGVRRIIQDRLAPLASTARELLTAAAVLGQGFGFDLSAGWVASRMTTPCRRWTRCSRAGFSETVGGEGRSGDGRYVFAHDKIRDVVYMEAGEARRRVFHRRALEASRRRPHQPLSWRATRRLQGSTRRRSTSASWPATRRCGSWRRETRPRTTLRRSRWRSGSVVATCSPNCTPGVAAPSSAWRCGRTPGASSRPRSPVSGSMSKSGTLRSWPTSPRRAGGSSMSRRCVATRPRPLLGRNRSGEAIWRQRPSPGWPRPKAPLGTFSCVLSRTGELSTGHERWVSLLLQLPDTTSPQTSTGLAG